jgi:glutathionylspermidine synthase
MVRMVLTPDEAIYLDRRMRFFERYHRKWRGTLNDPYDLLEPREIRMSDLDALNQAVLGVVRVYRKVSKVLKKAPIEAYSLLGLPDEVVYLAKVWLPVSDFLLVRFDFVQVSGGYNLDCNFDNPGLIVEMFVLNALACKDIGRADPNGDTRIKLSQYLTRSVAAATKFVICAAENCRVGICARSSYTRDVDSALLITEVLRASKTVDADFVALEELTFDEDGLYDGSGLKLDFLIRLYPLMEFCRWGIPHRRKAGVCMDHKILHALIGERKIAMANSPFASVLESKAIQAIIWEACEEGMLFCRKEQEYVRKYILPTTFERPQGTRLIVEKPTYRGGGDGVVVSDSFGNVSERGWTSPSAEEPRIYQEYVKAPVAATMTEEGIKELRTIVSAFVVGGQDVGICFRSGRGITDSSWWIAPAYVGESP